MQRGGDSNREVLDTVINTISTNTNTTITPELQNLKAESKKGS